MQKIYIPNLWKIYLPNFIDFRSSSSDNTTNQIIWYANLMRLICVLNETLGRWRSYETT